MAAKKDIPAKAYFDAWVEAGMNYSKAADIMGVVAAAVRMGVKKYKRDTGDQTTKPVWMPTAAIAAHSQAPEGYYVKGVSTYYGEDGDVKGQWVKTTADQEALRQAQDAAYKALSEDLPRLDPVPAPASCLERLCNLYTITDAHVGMHAWHRETGEDWDLAIAEKVIAGVFLQMIASAPPAKVGIVNQMGDYLHTDSFKALTPASGHVLDADSRYQKIVEVAIRVLRRIIRAALEKHEHVVVNMLDANHDPVGGTWMRIMFSALYENEPRVKVDTSPSPFTVYRHGNTMLAFHHGHTAKMSDLPLLFAARFPEVWGAATHRYCHVGHLHHVEEKEHPGMIVTRHPTLAAPDAYSARAGYDSKRAASSITYHTEHGQVGRQTFVPEMLEA